MNNRDLCIRTARLIERGKLQEIVNILNSFGVFAVVQLKPEQYTAYSDKLSETEE